MRIHISGPGFSERQDLSQFTGNSSGEIDGCRITMGGNFAEESDAWFVVEDTAQDLETRPVPPRQLHFLSAETAWEKGKFLSREKTLFLKQFDSVYTFYPTRIRGATFAPPFLPWMVNANHGSVFHPHRRDVNFLRKLDTVEKTQKLSMFCSNQAWLPGHRRRLEFAAAAKQYFGDDLVWFGNGVNQVDEKWDGLAQFKRTIVLENNDYPGVFSEKIMDPYLTLTQPFFAGGAGITASFPLMRQQILDLSDFKSSLGQISHLIDEEVSEEDFSAILRGKYLVLEKYHFLKRICNIAKSVQSIHKSTKSMSYRTVRTRNSFTT